MWKIIMGRNSGVGDHSEMYDSCIGLCPLACKCNMSALQVTTIFFFFYILAVSCQFSWDQSKLVFLWFLCCCKDKVDLFSSCDKIDLFSSCDDLCFVSSQMLAAIPEHSRPSYAQCESVFVCVCVCVCMRACVCEYIHVCVGMHYAYKLMYSTSSLWMLCVCVQN